MNPEGLLEIRQRVIERQRNVDPLASALNQGRFFGILARGTRLNALQRLGAILPALPSVLLPLLMLASPVLDVWLTLANLLTSLFWIIVGALILSHALLPNPPPPTEDDELPEETSSPD